MKLNPLNLIDFYKADHRRQYPEGTEFVYGNMTPRSSRLYGGTEFFDDKVVNFGMQGVIQWLLIDLFNKEFFEQPKEKVVAEYKRRMDTSLGEGAIPVEHIEELHDLGYLPLNIYALPEGVRSNIKVPVFTVVNTDPKFFWLTNYVETMLSNALWKSYTTATIAYEYRRILEYFYEETGCDKDGIGVSVHDFCARGMSTPYDATMNGAGHLLSFVGTDTVSAIDYLEEYYGADATKELIGCSVPATEHSVMCMGTKENEVDTFRRLITELYPSGIVSIVSDTWDFWKVITEYTVELKDEILNRQPNSLGLCKTVFRPDSGDPVKIITGYTWIEDDVDLDKCWDYYYENEVFPEVVKIKDLYFMVEKFSFTSDDGVDSIHLGKEMIEAEVKGAVECLWDIFGGTETDKGYKVLNDKVGLIYGDSITRQRAVEILERLRDKGFAANNIVFGVGSYTYQHITRDSLGFAMKATYGIVNDEEREIFKDPVTDSGVKKSAKGLLKVTKVGDDYVMTDQLSDEEFFLSVVTGETELRQVFFNGHLVNEESLSTIRDRLLSS